MLLKQLGEFGLIDRIRRRRPKRKNPNIIVDMGDDAFAARLSPGTLLVSTNDLLIENIHFRRAWTSPFELGYKSIAVNLSDLAAMGKCKPLFCLVGLGIPGDIAVDYVDKLYTGMHMAAQKYGLTIVGGDTVASRKDIVISITLFGEAEKKNLLTRNGAKVGDILFVSGSLGDSRAGLELLAKGIIHAKGVMGKLLKKHRKPEPRVKLAHLLTSTGFITCMIDTSDSFVESVLHITESSHVGARINIEKLPISTDLKLAAQKFPSIEVAQFALSGGEDYELLFTAKPEALSALLRKVKDITPVGEITKGNEVKYYLHGKQKKITPKFFTHFS